MGNSLPTCIQGTTVTFLTKDKTGPASAKWIRNVADVYGDPDQLKNNGTGILPSCIEISHKWLLTFRARPWTLCSNWGL